MKEAAEKVDLRPVMRLIRQEILDPYVSSQGSGFRSRSMSLGSAEIGAAPPIRRHNRQEQALESLAESPSQQRAAVSQNFSPPKGVGGGASGAAGGPASAKKGTASATCSPPTSRRNTALRATSVSPSTLTIPPATSPTGKRRRQLTE